MKRSAFTLIELLVVIAVVTILATMLLVAVNRARETARRNQCLVQQRDLVTAMITYDKEYNGLPGSLNQLGTTPIHSWAVAIFPMIGESKRYDFLIKDSSDTSAIVPLPALLCPSDKPEGNARLNYVVTCGPVASAGITGDIAPAFTLFKDRRAALTSLNLNTKVKIEDIPDGASYTILLSENVDAGVWHADWTTTAPGELITGSGVFTRDKKVVESLGFIWWDRNLAPNSPVSGPRPSSKHPGAVNVGYADGSAKPMNDDIDLTEYLRAVCPDDAKAREAVGDGGLGLSL
jgi:prepilin-type N-terminal cleavage/methylation domain-containing protein/prepilin-type processing-associated H-X9-DG protein